MVGPSLNVARNRHSAVVLDGCIYTYGGAVQQALNSIEKLSVDSNERNWTIFSIEGLSARCRAFMCRLNHNEIVVAGGCNTERLSDAFAFNPKTQTVRTIVDQSDFSFYGRSDQVALNQSGEVFALGRDKDDQLHAMALDAAANTLKSLNCFGKCTN